MGTLNPFIVFGFNGVNCFPDAPVLRSPGEDEAAPLPKQEPDRNSDLCTMRSISSSLFPTVKLTPSAILRTLSMPWGLPVVNLELHVLAIVTTVLEAYYAHFSVHVVEGAYRAVYR